MSDDQSPYIPPTPPQPPSPPPSPDPAAGQPYPSTPFEPEKVRPVIGRGCGKPLAIGCGLFLVLFLVGIGIFTVKMYDLLAWTIDMMGNEISQRAPEEMTAADADRLRAATAAAAARARSGEVDETALRRLQGGFLEISGKVELTREEVLRFIDTLEAFAGGEARPAPEAEPAPEAGPETGAVEEPAGNR